MILDLESKRRIVVIYLREKDGRAVSTWDYCFPIKIFEVAHVPERVSSMMSSPPGCV
jgi:hypothetical protein